MPRAHDRTDFEYIILKGIASAWRMVNANVQLGEKHMLTYDEKLALQAAIKRDNETRKQFFVGTQSDNSGTKIICCIVWSYSKLGGVRRHFSCEGQHASSLECARLACKTEADRLEAEAIANRRKRSD